MTQVQSITVAEQPRRLEGDAYTAEIRRLNDAFRRCPVTGRVMLTRGIYAKSAADQYAILSRVHSFSEFSEDNDPWGEHDFGAFDYDGEKIFWKIDYYDRQSENGSRDPTDPKVTCRVLTVMLASEY